MELVILIIIIILIYLLKPENNIIKVSPKLNIKGFEIIYTDQKGNYDKTKVVISEILKSENYDLRGKPDYIFLNERKKEFIPVELKSGKIKDKTEPYYSDLMQLVAYFLIIEDIFEITPLEGRIIYKDYMFIIKNTKKLRNELIKTLNNMRFMLENGEGNANASFVNCRYCICKGTVCEYNK